MVGSRTADTQMSPRIVGLVEIERALIGADLVASIEQGFARYSAGDAVVPPIGELLFDEPPGDVHIKYGYLRGDEHFVVKIAGGFYRNPQLGLPANSGLVLVFRQRTGELDTILLDDGRLTDVRTAVAGAVAAKYLAPRAVQRIGVIGTGVQARLQVEYLRGIVDCGDIFVWGRSDASVDTYRRALEAEGYAVTRAATPADVAAECRLIVTATPSIRPVLQSVESGTHVTGVGADTAEKNEIAASVFARADVVVADSLVQCRERGDLHHALAAGAVDAACVIELGDVVRGVRRGRTSDDEITVCDLTGVAVQDIQIARAVLTALRHSERT
jgi:ornithine cyclodeaminase